MTGLNAVGSNVKEPPLLGDRGGGRGWSGVWKRKAGELPTRGWWPAEGEKRGWWCGRERKADDSSEGS